MIRVTNSGVSAIIDPVGRATVVSETFTQQALLGEAKFMKGRSIYSKLGDIPWWIATGLMALAAFVRRREASEARF